MSQQETQPPRDMFLDVGQFQRKFKLPEACWTGGARLCHGLTEEEFRYRFSFMQEELEEFAKAYASQDPASMLDALVDLVYVAIGTAHYMGAPFNVAWDMVHEANMKKVLAPAEGDDGHKRGNAEVIRKPAGWQAPDIKELWRRAAALSALMASFEIERSKHHDNDRA